MNKMTAMEQMILVFVQLQRKPSLIMLADLFGISASIVSRTFISWVLFLKEELMFLLPFSTVDKMLGMQVSKPFKDICNICGIVDCT